MIQVRRFNDPAEMFNTAANELLSHSRSCIGLAAGRTPSALYAELVRLHLGRLSQTHFFHLDEFIGSDLNHPPGFAEQLNAEILKPLRIPFDQSHYLNGRAKNLIDEGIRYEQEIASVGGIQLQILGLGINGHLAFNEPGSAFDSKTRVVTLTPETKIQNQPMFGTDPVPSQALTMGLGTILDAEEIWLFVTQPEKKNILMKCLHETPSADFPASCLQGHKNAKLWTTLGI